jgi:4-hydroxy 2-oxovalerate aldolase
MGAPSGGTAVLDCTIRDGGLLNRWQFSDRFVRGVLAALSSTGVELVEVGYRTSSLHASRSEHGPWRFCDEADLRRVLEGLAFSPRLAAMVDVGRVEPAQIGRSHESVISMFRVACYARQIDEAVRLAAHCLEQGFDASVNLMAVSELGERELAGALEALARSPVPTVYLVDSFGALYPARIRELVATYRAALPGKRIGIHAHNNLQLALANTIEAAAAGATILDATLFGLGRGAGNCPLELLLAWLADPARDLEPVLAAVEEHLLPLRRELEWGYHLPYMLTGALNLHPRDGIAAMAEPARRARELYRELLRRRRS